MKSGPFCPSTLRWLTFFFWLATAVLSVWLISISKWSVTLQQKADLGFNGSFTEPIVAVSLVTSQDELEAMIPSASEQGKKDRQTLKKVVYTDFWFLLAYPTLLSLFTLRHPPGAVRRWGVILALLTAVFDVLENLQLLAILGEGPWGLPYVPRLLPLASQLKWMTFFLWSAAAGYFELIRPLGAHLPSLLRIGLALLLLSGGCIGLSWACGLLSGLLLQNGYTLLTLALLSMVTLLLSPDESWKTKRAFTDD